MQLRDARVLVTGGSSGIGYATARRLIDAGSRVAITGRDLARLNAATDRLGAPGDNISPTAGTRGAARGTAYDASKVALGGMTECWRAERRAHNIRVMLVNPSEVITEFAARAGYEQTDNPTKLRGEKIAHAVKAALEMDDRGFITELTVFATNPKD